MREAAWVWLAGGLTTAVTIANAALILIVGFRISVQPELSPQKHLLYVAFGLQCAAVLSLAYFSTIYTRTLNDQTFRSRTGAWIQYWTGAAVATISSAVAGVSLIWLCTQRENYPELIEGDNYLAIIIAAISAWGINVTISTFLFVILGFWTKNVIRAQIVRSMNLDFGIRLPPMEEIAPGSRLSFGSRDPTLMSRSSSRAPSSSFRTSASTRVGTAYSQKSKLFRGSTRSSTEIPPFPAGEATSLDSAFDNWDTSSVHREMRSTVLGGTPPSTRNGLEPIPGSRPESPEDDIALPSSPIVISSDSIQVSEDLSSPPRYIQVSSPPSSPPNFSRPSSKSQNKPFGAMLEVSASMQEIIHPLFRQGSPDPPPKATPGTMVTASPFANRPITPKTLSKLRSNQDMRRPEHIARASTGQWRTMPSIDATPRPRSKSHSSATPSIHEMRPSTAGSVTSTFTMTTAAARSDIGSPGPSVYEEDELPPVIPGFVLSAGQRSSMIGYGKRKSTRQTKRDSAGFGGYI